MAPAQKSHSSRAKRAAQKKVTSVMHKFGTGKLKSSSGAKVTSRKQAIAIALSEADRLKQRSRQGR